MLELCGLEEEIFLQVDKNRRLEPPDFVYVVKYINPRLQEHRAYPELFAVVGGQTPDLRGLFLRGHGGNSAALGVQQGDAIRNVTGTFDARVAGMWREGTGPFRVGGGGGQKVAVDGYGYPYDVSFDLSRCVPTASENRPVNTAVRYLIRAHP